MDEFVWNKINRKIAIYLMAIFLTMNVSFINLVSQILELGQALHHQDQGSLRTY